MLGTEQNHLDRWLNRRDGAAFREMVDDYGGMVFAVARRILGNAADAEEVTQECFALLAGVESAPAAPLGPWLHRVATNRALNRLKADRARRAREAHSFPLETAIPSPEWNELERLLDEAIADLPDSARELLVGHYLLGKTHHQLALDTKVPRQTVSYRIARGLELLRKSLEARGVPVGGAALAGLAGTLKAEAIPPALAVSLGKTALTAACMVPVTGTAAKNLIGVMIMTAKTKLAIAMALTLAALLGIWWLATPEKPQAQAKETAPAVASPKLAVPPQKARVAAKSVSPAAAGEAPQEVPAAEAVAPTAPRSELWAVTSYTWNGTPSGEAEEILHDGDAPKAQMTAQDLTLSFNLVQPWSAEVPFASFSGDRVGDAVTLHSEGKSGLSLLLKGRFRANGSELHAEGGYATEKADAAQQEELERYHIAIHLKRIGPGIATPELKDLGTREQRRADTKKVAAALHAYAVAHGGKLPATLAELMPDYIDDDTLLKTANHRAVRYEGGALPAGLLEPETPWESFHPSDPMRDRLAAWEAYQQERWGSDSPLLPPAVSYVYDDPYLEITTDALGRTTERDYPLGTPGLDDAPEIGKASMDHLKRAGLAIVGFESDHDGQFANGWLSLYPKYLEDPTLLTHPADEAGTLSYQLLSPEAGPNAAGENSAAALNEVPVASEYHAYGTREGRNVAFADGHVEFLSNDAYATLCIRFKLPIP